jgi:hypothetical protein
VFLPILEEEVYQAMEVLMVGSFGELTMKQVHLKPNPIVPEFKQQIQNEIVRDPTDIPLAVEAMNSG